MIKLQDGPLERRSVGAYRLRAAPGRGLGLMMEGPSQATQRNRTVGVFLGGSCSHNLSAELTESLEVVTLISLKRESSPS